jgi:hypothetical protein
MLETLKILKLWQIIGRLVRSPINRLLLTLSIGLDVKGLFENDAKLCQNEICQVLDMSDRGE